MRPSWRGAIFRKALSLLVSCAIRSASSNNAINPDTNRAYNEIVIGGLGFQDEGTLYAQWNDTFSAYVPLGEVHLRDFYPRYGLLMNR